MSPLPENQRENPSRENWPVGKSPEQSNPVETNGAVGGKLSSTTKSNIAIISAVGTVSILLMLFGEFDGKASRVLSTLALFGIFTLFTSTNFGWGKSALFMPLAQVGNIYMLCLSLILIWGTLTVDYYDDFALFPLTICIALLVKLGVIITQKVSEYMDAKQEQLALAGTLATVGFAATTVLFTLPIGLYDLVDFGEVYWKLAIAVLLFTGLVLSIMSLLIWAFRDKSEPSAKASNASNLPAYDKPRVDIPNTKPVANQIPVTVPPRPVTPPPAPADQTQVDSPVSVPVAKQEEQDPKEQKAAVRSGAPVFAKPAPASLPWPVFPNGQPLPAKTNGRPDFTALQNVASMYAESERQFFG